MPGESPPSDLPTGGCAGTSGQDQSADLGNVEPWNREPWYEKTPGSDAAAKAGCICPVIDNARGRGRGNCGEKFGWVMVVGCPIHAPSELIPQEAPPDRP